MNANNSEINMVSCGAVVMLYHPPESVVQNIGTYLPEIEKLCIFDNSPEASKDLLSKIGPSDKIEYMTKGVNVGVGAALNTAAKWAIEKRFDYLLTMDQDSAATKAMIGTLLSVISQNPSIGLVTPFHIVRNEHAAPPEQPLEPVLTAMTSGNILRLDVYEKVGGFMENLFIDYIDIEYCLRLHVKGYSVIRANRALLAHTVGNLASRSFLGRTVHPSNHQPVRLYYRTRNRFFVKSMYKQYYPEYFSYNAKLFWREIVKILLYESERIRKIIMICRGYMAFLRKDYSSIPMI